jgi:hypothetical protein
LHACCTHRTPTLNGCYEISVISSSQWTTIYLQTHEWLAKLVSSWEAAYTSCFKTTSEYLQSRIYLGVLGSSPRTTRYTDVLQNPAKDHNQTFYMIIMISTKILIMKMKNRFILMMVSNSTIIYRILTVLRGHTGHKTTQFVRSCELAVLGTR